MRATIERLLTLAVVGGDVETAKVLTDMGQELMKEESEAWREAAQAGTDDLSAAAYRARASVLCEILGDQTELPRLFERTMRLAENTTQGDERVGG